ncbi:MAG: UDP-N-acetylmuramate dehydrogenase [Prolixibacteraceae bacterium]|nr:UDP-N-acetylmuramate dehydrogenase [Prolixibacteraceae bacterium]
MVRFFENYSLKMHNTFGVEAASRYFFEFTEQDDLITFLNSNESWRESDILILGGGSNMLFTNDFDGLILHPNIPGIKIIKEDRQSVWIETGAGEIWDDFVSYCVESGAGGIENLSLIPGTTGAAPVQNISAYGQEVAEVIETVKGYDLYLNRSVQYSADECKFEYRNSIFKSELKNRFIITSVIFKLEKFPSFRLGYGNLHDKVLSLGEINIKNIREAVVDIRSSKLPDPAKLGNAGSFFKNPVVKAEVAEEIRAKFPEMPVYPAGGNYHKLAAGWLIEQAGWKGYREKETGVHEKQALVIVNYGSTTGREIFDFSEKIRCSVLEKFGIDLEREVNCI